MSFADFNKEQTEIYEQRRELKISRKARDFRMKEIQEILDEKNAFGEPAPSDVLAEQEALTKDIKLIDKRLVALGLRKLELKAKEEDYRKSPEGRAEIESLTPDDKKNTEKKRVKSFKWLEKYLTTMSRDCTSGLTVINFVKPVSGYSTPVSGSVQGISVQDAVDKAMEWRPQ